jgi:hypothetical protein
VKVFVNAPKGSFALVKEHATLGLKKGVCTAAFFILRVIGFHQNNPKFVKDDASILPPSMSSNVQQKRNKKNR